MGTVQARMPVGSAPREKKARMLLPIAAAFLACLAAGPASAAAIELLYSGPPDSAALRGLQLGIDESNRQGRFLGVRLDLASASGDSLSKGALAVFADRRGAIGELAERVGRRALFNLSDSADGLRSACLANALHIIPSDAMKAAAVAQWREANPGSEAAAAAWHGDAVKFSARDLNKRYAKRFGTAMDEQAWAGWFAARAVGDTLMRHPGADAAQLLRLLKESGGFDGQKGDPHDFRASGQLRQPLVLVGPDGSLLGEAPVRGVSSELDSLGAASLCE